MTIIKTHKVCINTRGGEGVSKINKEENLFPHIRKKFPAHKKSSRGGWEDLQFLQITNKSYIMAYTLKEVLYLKYSIGF